MTTLIAYPWVGRVRPVLQFALALIQASLNDLRALVVSVFTPLFMLILFWLVSRPSKPGGTELLGFVFPAIVGLTVMLGGQTLTVRLVNWRREGVFQRLAATPTPLGHVLLGMALAQAW